MAAGSSLSPISKDKEDFLSKLLLPNGEQLPNPYGLPLSGWFLNKKEWPDLEYPEVHIFLTSTPSEYGEEMKTFSGYKNMEAYKSVIQVGNVMYHQIDYVSEYCFLAAEVMPYRLRDCDDYPTEDEKERGNHKAWVCLQKTTAHIHTAHCTCMEGGGPICNHAAALLFKVEMSVRLGLTKSEENKRHPMDDIAEELDDGDCRPLAEIFAEYQKERRKKKKEKRRLSRLQIGPSALKLPKPPPYP